ncbi:MAG: DNA-directed RNA polymerase subunit delta [Bacilli bacterium]|nr:DNA-directed RNA polymerase subunit delta [Bacilli bacterium]
MAKENLIKERESKTDIAYRLMSKRKKERSFYDLWEDVKAELVKLYGEETIENIDEDISFFYTNLTLDGRFVNVGDNKWNLRERVTFDKVHIDMNDIYVEDEEDISEDNEDSKDEYVADDYEDSYDDSTGSDADINQYRDQKVVDEDEDL